MAEVVLHAIRKENFRDVIRQLYMSMCLRMSESERYRREVSNLMYTPDKAIREWRGEASLAALVDKIDQPCAKLLAINEDEDPLAVFDPRDHLWKPEYIVRAEDHIDIFFPFENGLPFLLGNTSAYPDNEIWIVCLQFAEGSEQTVDLVLRVFAY